MAEVVTEIPGKARETSAKYLRFLDGQVWKLQRGVDFEPTEHVFTTNLRQLAYRHLKSASIVNKDGFVYVQAKPRAPRA